MYYELVITYWILSSEAANMSLHVLLAVDIRLERLLAVWAHEVPLLLQGSHNKSCERPELSSSLVLWCAAPLVTQPVADHRQLSAAQTWHEWVAVPGTEH